MFGFAFRKSQVIHDGIVQSLTVVDERHFIDVVDIQRRNDILFRDVAEQRDLGFDVVGQEAVGPAEEDVRLDTDLAQFLHAVLRRLRFQLPGCADERDEGQVHKYRVLPCRLRCASAG